MTNQEAIDRFKGSIEFLKEERNKDHMFDSVDEVLGDEMREQYGLAIAALKKQIPMRPSFWGDGYADEKPAYDEWRCPSCGHSYEVDFEEYKCCPECGQRIDWEDK